jgi:hypothetical protein
MPILFGFANYLVPLMIGARDLAFPRLNAFGFWLTLFGGLLLYLSYLAGDGLYGAGSAPDVAWFAYSPLTGRAFSPGNSTDYWNLAILLSGFGTIATSVNLIATTVSLRCPGMTLSRMPLFVWMMLVVAGMTVVILPPLSAAQIMLLFDRFLGAHFFDTQAGRCAVLWQHFFWFSGILRSMSWSSCLRLRLEIIPVVLPEGHLRLSDDGGGHGLHWFRVDGVWGIICSPWAWAGPRTLSSRPRRCWWACPRG